MNNIETIKQLFDCLNKNLDYLVLRNWDDLFEEKIYGDGHEDIDILCRDLESFMNLTGGKPVFNSKYRNNYIVHIGILKVRFDVRFVGDGYYPQKWEDDMLRNRKLNDAGVYIPSDEDYFYSLAYHALLQKPVFSEEYQKKVEEAYNVTTHLSQKLDTKEIRDMLIVFCSKNNYKVEIPSDPGVFLNSDNLKFFEVNRSFKRLIRKRLLSLSYKIKYILNKLF